MKLVSAELLSVPQAVFPSFFQLFPETSTGPSHVIYQGLQRCNLSFHV